jgi:O-antigen/teichoic acid export membrane protein
MAIAIALPMTFLSDWIVEFLYGGQYNEAGSVLMIHIWTGVFVAFGIARGQWMLSENLQKYSLVFVGIGVTINIVFNYILIPIMGIDGAAIAILLAQGIGTIFVPLFIADLRLSFAMMIKSFSFMQLRSYFAK